MIHTCPVINHRLYWMLGGSCPCLDQVMNDFADMVRNSDTSEEVCSKLYSKHPWIKPLIPEKTIQMVFVDLYDM